MSEHDWPEDYKHENGYYLRKCQCGAEFVGHKRRFTCKVCYLSHLEQQLAELREAANDYQRTVNTWRVIGFGNTGKNAFFSAGDKLAALLQEKGE